MPPIPTIELAPKAIRKEVVAQLKRHGVAGGNVVSTRPREWSPDDEPGVNVFSPGSESDSISKHLPRFETTLRVVCSGNVKLTEGGEFEDKEEALGDAIDDLELAIKQAILSSRTFAASFKYFAGMSVQKGMGTNGQDFRGGVSIEFRFVFNEQWELVADDPATVDPDFTDLRIEIQPGVEDATPPVELRESIPV